MLLKHAAQACQLSHDTPLRWLARGPTWSGGRPGKRISMPCLVGLVPPGVESFQVAAVLLERSRRLSERRLIMQRMTTSLRLAITLVLVSFSDAICPMAWAPVGSGTEGNHHW